MEKEDEELIESLCAIVRENNKRVREEEAKRSLLTENRSYYYKSIEDLLKDFPDTIEADEFFKQLEN